jgi:hypothetical protein
MTWARFISGSENGHEYDSKVSEVCAYTNEGLRRLIL